MSRPTAISQGRDMTGIAMLDGSTLVDAGRLEFSDDDTGVWAFDVSGHVDEHNTQHVFIEVNGESADLDVPNALALAELIIRVCGTTVRRSG